MTDKENRPLNAKSFLRSPLTTLTSSSDHPSTHDILEAYHVLTVRIKLLSPSFDPAVPALHPIKQNANILAETLKRDLERALVNPLYSPSAWSSYSHNAGFSDSIPRSQIPILLTEDDVLRSQESVLVCHYALRLLSLLFRFEVLYQAFDGAWSAPHYVVTLNLSIARDLASLLRATLALISQDPLPTPNSSKTLALAVWVLKTQRLPATVLREVKIAGALTSIFSSEMGSVTVIGDALKVRYHAIDVVDL